MSVEATIICTPCLRDDKTVDAVKYCVDCNENFCRHCLRIHIKQFVSVSKQHKLLNKDEMPDWLKAASTGKEEKCTRHPDNELDSYCEDHDLLCCGACVVIEHSSCEHVQDIYQIFGETESERSVDVLMQDLQAMINDFKDIKEARKKDQSHLRKTTAKSLYRIRDLREKYNNIFDELEKNAVEEVNTESIKNDDSIQNDLKQSEASLTLLDMGLKQIGIAEGKSSKTIVESNLNFLNGRKLLKDMKKIRDELQKKNTVKTIDFVANQHTEKFISSLKSIGTCIKSTRAKSDSRVKMITFSPALDTDEEVCDIKDAFQTNAGMFLLVDSENKKIKLINRDLNFVKYFDLKKDTKSNPKSTNEPFGICCTKDDEFALSMTRDKVVILYKMEEDNLQLKNCIPVGEYCRGIAYSKGNKEIFVACGGGSYADEGLGQIRVYSIKGTTLRSFPKDEGGKILSPKPTYLALSADETKLFIADSHKGIITVSVAEGQFLRLFGSSQLMEARGLCIDYNGDVIVCGYESNRVLRIYEDMESEDMKSYDTLVKESDGLQNPQAVVYDSFSSRCLVYSTCTNKIHVFDV